MKTLEEKARVSVMLNIKLEVAKKLSVEAEKQGIALSTYIQHLAEDDASKL